MQILSLCARAGVRTYATVRYILCPRCIWCSSVEFWSRLFTVKRRYADRFRAAIFETKAAFKGQIFLVSKKKTTSDSLYCCLVYYLLQTRRQKKRQNWRILVLQILNQDGTFLAYVTSGQRHTNWMAEVQCARDEHEQNLDVVQIGSKIYYKVTKVPTVINQIMERKNVSHKYYNCLVVK